MQANPGVELVCPVDSLDALKTAVDCGAGAVSIRIRARSDIRRYFKLLLHDPLAERGVLHAHDRGVRLYVEVEAVTSPLEHACAQATIECAAAIGADAIVVANGSLMDYVQDRHPKMALHFDTPLQSADEGALRFHVRRFGIRRAVLPRRLPIALLEALANRSPVPLQLSDAPGLSELSPDQSDASGSADVLDTFPDLRAAGVQAITVGGHRQTPRQLAEAIHQLRHRLDRTAGAGQPA